MSGEDDGRGSLIVQAVELGRRKLRNKVLGRFIWRTLTRLKYCVMDEQRGVLPLRE